ncbi:hypothetical protein AB5N19_10255 [Seiridium cardinale]|uniref:Uncharacterized protein n=1 Tax=Seiridium cardinale TaxID=138064 RepID=A0ABR2X6E7_9PEZI
MASYATAAIFSSLLRRKVTTCPTCPQVGPKRSPASHRDVIDDSHTRKYNGRDWVAPLEASDPSTDLLGVPCGRDDQRGLLPTYFLGMKAESMGGAVTTILPTTLSATLDMTEPFLEVPEAGCKVFQDALGLQYDSVNNLYLLDSTVRTRLRELSPNITIEASADGGEFSSPSFTVTLPYDAFDHKIAMCNGEYLPYFPIRPAKSDTGNVLGRVNFSGNT